ncbi:MAG: serine/threonine-protein kinase [Terriglobia bacterium]
MKKIGRYEIVEEVGRGAMGVVYKASDPTIGRLVAIKVLSLDSAHEEGVPGAQEIFMREARAAGRLSHPGIVTIHDALEDTDSKNNYIVMEFIQGRTLENILLYGPPLSVEKSIDIVRQIAEALDYAHQQQIIHRDLKPANILLTDDGRAKITDFGIAKIMAAGGSLRTSAVMGTPAYMSPEQVTGGEIDARSDLFALGILTYLMLAGEKPFAGDTAAVMFKIVYEDPVPPSQLRPELGPGHDYLVLRSLVKDRNKRYRNAREFLTDLDDVQHGRSPRSEVSFPLAEIRTSDRTLIASAGHPPWREQVAPAPEKKWTWVMEGMGAGIVLLILLLGLGVLIYRGRQESTTSAAVSKPATILPAPQGTPNPPKSPGPVSNSNQKSAPKIVKAPPSKKPLEKVAAASHPSGEPVNNAKMPARANATTSAAPNKAAARVIQLFCSFELQDAVLTVSNDTRVIFQGNLKGRKKGGFLRIGEGYAGTISNSLSIPAGTHRLVVHVRSADGAANLTGTTSVAPSSNGPGILRVMVSKNNINLYWAIPARR